MLSDPHSPISCVAIILHCNSKMHTSPRRLSLLFLFLLLVCLLLEPVDAWIFNRRHRKLRHVVDSIANRRTINAFADTLPSNWEESIKTSVESATMAPNHKRTEPWRFHLLGPQAIRAVCELNAQIVSETKGEAAGKAKLERWLAMPGWLVVTCQASDDDIAVPTSQSREDYAACCCAVQNLCLSLHAAGMGTKWTTGPVNFHPDFAAAAGLSKNEFVVGTIWFGTPKEQPSAPIKKKSLSEVLIRHE